MSPKRRQSNEVLLMMRIGKFVVAALALLVFSSTASASTIVVNCGTVSGPTELASAAILCPQFDLGGSVLSSISIAVSGGISGSITLINGDVIAQTGSGTSTTSFSFGALTGFTFVNPIFSASFTTGLQNLSGGQTLTVSGLSGTGSGILGSDTTSFAAYTGAGIFTIPVSTSTLFSAGGTGGFFQASQASIANATAVVTYEYGPATPVPEPTSAVLLGLGLIAVGYKVRKRL
jgi:hypothetical protein